jgi:hypothetical protein
VNIKPPSVRYVDRTNASSSSGGGRIVSAADVCLAHCRLTITISPNGWRKLEAEHRRKRHTSMTEDIDVKINVDTLMDGDQYFVRTEIETRSVTIHGPFPDLQRAQQLKTEQIEHRSSTIDAIKQNLRQTVSALASR